MARRENNLTQRRREAEVAKKVRLGDVATYINGYAFKPSDWSDIGKPIIRIQDLTGNSYRMNYFGGRVPPKYNVVPGDVLISWSASLGVYVWNRENALLNQHIFKVVFDKMDVDKSYFFHQVSAILKNASSEAHGCTMKHLTKPVFDALPFIFLPISEQHRIAAVLDKICELKKNAETRLEKLDALVKSRFVEMFGDGMFPESYLGEFCEVGSGKRVFADEFKDHGIPFLRGTEISALAKGVYDKPLYYIAENHYKELARHTGVPKVGDLLLPSICSDGLIWKVDTNSRFYFKDGRVLWIKVPKSVDSEYLRFAISRILKRDYQKVASGTTFAEMKIVNLKKIIVTLPPLTLQREFAAFVAKVDKLRDTARQTVEAMDTLYRSKLQEYFG